MIKYNLCFLQLNDESIYKAKSKPSLNRENIMYKFYLFFLLLSFNLTLYGQNRKDRHTVDSLKQVLTTVKSDSERVKLCLGIGKAYAFTEPDEAILYALKVYNNSVKPESRSLYFKAEAAGILHESYSQKKDSINSIFYLEQHVHLAKKTKDSDLIARSLGLAGGYYSTSNLYKSIEYYHEFIRLNDSLGLSDVNYMLYMSLSGIMLEMGQTKEALNYLYKSSQLKDTSDMRLMSESALYGCFCDVFKQTKQYDSLYYYACKSYEVGKDIYGFNLPVISTKLEAAFYVNKIAECKNLCFTVISESERVGIPDQLPIAYAYLGGCHLNTSVDSAVYYLNKALPLAKGENKLLVTIYDFLSQAMIAKNNPVKAIEYMKLYTDLTIADRNLIIEKQALFANTQYETARKEAQIELLDKQTQTQRKAQIYLIIGLILAVASAAFAYFSFVNKRKLAATLEQSNREKEVFLKEIHHRVKNNLQIISSLLYLQFKDTEDEKMLTQLKQAQDRIKSMSLVHNKLYETSDVVNVKIKEYMSDLAVGILSSNTPAGKQIQLSVEADETINFSLDTSISLGLMLNELITNSCKYAFTAKDKGIIRISMVQQGDQYVLEVKDDGNGLADNFDKKNSLGLKLVKNMARQMRGKVRFLNDNGTLVQITLNKMAA